MEKIEQPKDFDAILRNNDSFLLFKHSLTCPISRQAFHEFQQFLKTNPSFSGYYLAIQESRPLSNYIADYFSIKHESPQIFFIQNGKVKWHASHWKIRREEIKEALKGEGNSV